MNNWIICLGLAYPAHLLIKSVDSIMFCIKLVYRLLQSLGFDFFH